MFTNSKADESLNNKEIGFCLFKTQDLQSNIGCSVRDISAETMYSCLQLALLIFDGWRANLRLKSTQKNERISFVLGNDVMKKDT